MRAAFTVEFRPRVAGLALLLTLAAPAGARAQDLPEGLGLGPWIFAPSFGTSYEVDSNVFFKAETAKTNDRVTTYRGDLRAWLPFRNSMLELNYGASKERFADARFPRDLTQVGGFDLEMNFKSGDTLALRDTYRRDFARSEEIDVGGELTFNGEPYTLNRWDIELSRTDPARQGYLVRVRRQDFIYDGDADIGFFEYRGFHNTFEYRQPVPNYRSWVLRYDTRRFNHYEPLGPVGRPFRQERTDTVQIGLRGFLGEDRPYRVHLGYGRFRYEGAEPSEFEGIVGSAAWRLRLGQRTKMELEAIRRPLPSNFETHYINNAVRAEFKRNWLRFEAGTELELTRNDYADNIVGLDCNGRREDTTYEADVHLGWRFHDRLEFEFASFFAKRSSTCASANYDAAGVETGIRLGWF